MAGTNALESYFNLNILGGRRTRTSGRKRTSRDSIDGHSSPKKIMLSEWVKGKAGESPQVQQWTVVKVKPEQQGQYSVKRLGVNW